MNKLKSNGVSAESQRSRVLAWLQANTLTTFEARTELDVMHPASRVQELRALGHDIKTHREVIHNGKNKHRIAKYVLFAGGSNA